MVIGRDLLRVLKINLEFDSETISSKISEVTIPMKDRNYSLNQLQIEFIKPEIQSDPFEQMIPDQNGYQSAK